MEVSVRAGDSLPFYSSLFKIPLYLIADSNPNILPNNLQIAQKIQLPGYITVPYVIKSNDTFWTIAKEKKIEAEAIALLNQNKLPEQLAPGEMVFLPERITAPLTNSKSAYHSKGLANLISQIKKVYPFISVTSIGSSVLGHPIHEIRVGTGPEKVHMNASFHANEWITTMVVMSLLNQYLLSLVNGSSIRGQAAGKFYKTVELSIVPMVNPDGVDLVINGPPLELRETVIAINDGSTDFIHWKANIRGVDLNRQFPANWELCQQVKQATMPASRDYPGISPLSEPEAIAMYELAITKNFDRIIAFHTQGEEFYWGYCGYEPPESELMAKEFERVSGYQAVRYVESHAGFKDWFIQEFQRPGFTVELGKGINPLPLSQFPQILNHAEAIFFAALHCKKP